MKKRLLFSSLILVIALTMTASTPVLAANTASFSAVGSISGITPGDVHQVGDSGWWRVAEREITGSISGDVSGDFTLTYEGMFKLTTQEGIFKGIFEVSGDTPCVLDAKGVTAPLTMVPTPTPYGVIDLPMLKIKGTWKFSEGGKGKGTFSAWLIFIPTPEGHVGSVVASEITLKGK